METARPVESISAMSPPDDPAGLPEVLPEDVPVTLPDLPPTLRVTTEQCPKNIVLAFLATPTQQPDSSCFAQTGEPIFQ